MDEFDCTVTRGLYVMLKADVKSLSETISARPKVYLTASDENADAGAMAGAMLVVLATTALNTLTALRTLEASYIAPPAVLENGACESADIPNIKQLPKHCHWGL